MNSFLIILDAFKESSSRFLRVLFELVELFDDEDNNDDVDVYESELSIDVFELIDVFLTFAELFLKFISFSIVL